MGINQAQAIWNTLCIRLFGSPYVSDIIVNLSEGTYNFFFLWLYLQHMEIPRARDWIWAAPAKLFHSHNDARSKPHLQPTPELVAAPDP